VTVSHLWEFWNSMIFMMMWSN